MLSYKTDNISYNIVIFNYAFLLLFIIIISLYITIYNYYIKSNFYYRFTEMIEKSFNFVFLSEMIGCTIIICFLEYGVLKVF